MSMLLEHSYLLLLWGGMWTIVSILWVCYLVDAIEVHALTISICNLEVVVYLVSTSAVCWKNCLLEHHAYFCLNIPSHITYSKCTYIFLDL
jgi:hypothetical protein